MIKKLSNKKNISSMQVLKTLQVLLQGNYTMQELISMLNENEQEHIFNNSVISKYINTCRACGIEIPKIHNKYFVASMPFGLELESRDTELLERLQNIVRQNMSKKSNKTFDSFIEKLNRFSNKKIARVEKSTYQISVEIFEHAIIEKRKIRLMFRNKTILDCVPLNIAENKNKIFFHVSANDHDRMIDAERITGIEVLSDKFIKNYSEQVVVYELKTPLAERYCLRENERLLKPFDGNSITVSNHGEDKEILLSRLLRYDDKCEIITPKTYRKEIKDIISSALKNYGEI